MELFTVVEVITQLVTYFMLASGLPPCLHMYRTKNTRNVPFIFFVLGFLNALSGIVYGTIIDLQSLVFVNLVGIAFNTLYILMYLLVCEEKGSAVTKLLSACSIFLVYYKYINSQGSSPEAVAGQLGLFVFVATVFLLASPFLEIIQCVQDKNADGLSRSMLYGGLSCSLSWLVYGLMLNDFYIYAPNVVGIAANVGKVLMILMYSGNTKKID